MTVSSHLQEKTKTTLPTWSVWNAHSPAHMSGKLLLILWDSDQVAPSQESLPCPSRSPSLMLSTLCCLSHWGSPVSGLAHCLIIICKLLKCRKGVRRVGQVEAENLQVWLDITRSELLGELHRNEDSWSLVPHLLNLYSNYPTPRWFLCIWELLH